MLISILFLIMNLYLILLLINLLIMNFFDPKSLEHINYWIFLWTILLLFFFFLFISLFIVWSCTRKINFSLRRCLSLFRYICNRLCRDLRNLRRFLFCSGSKFKLSLLLLLWLLNLLFLLWICDIFKFISSIWSSSCLWCFLIHFYWLYLYIP